MITNKPPLSIIPLGDKFLEIHLNTSAKPHQVKLVALLAILCIVPIALLPDIFVLHSTIILLILACIFIVVLIKTSSSHMLLKFDAVNDRLEFTIDQEVDNVVTKQTISTIRKIICSTHNSLTQPTSEVTENNSELMFLQIIIEFSFDYIFKVSPLYNVTLSDAKKLVQSLTIFFQKNNLAIPVINQVT